MPRVVHFELPADDPERAIKFYQEAFGWTFHKWDGPMDYWLVSTGDDAAPGINGGLMKRSAPEQVLSNVLQVDDIDAAVERAVAAGGTVAMPKHEIPSVGWYAGILDTEGTVVGLMQFTGAPM